MSSIVQSIIEGLVHVSIDSICCAACDHVLKDQDKFVRIAGKVGGFLLGEMVSEKAADWTNAKVNEAIAAYQDMANALEEAKDDEDYEVR